MLRNYYHKGKDWRMEGMNSKGWWFNGGTSFMSNGYVIYSNGLDGEPPNPTAVAQGNTYAYRLFDQRSIDKRSSYYQFTTQLKTIADKAAANESKFLQMKLEQLRKSDIDVKWLDKIEQAIKEQDYSSAYTLLMRRDKDLEAFRKELNSTRNKSLSKTNEFFNSQFYKYIAKRFQEQLEQQADNKINRTLTLDSDFEKIVDDYFKDVLNLSYEDNKSLGFIRDRLIEGLKQLGDSNGIRIDMSTNFMSDINVGEKKIPSSHFITKKGNFRTPRTIAENIARDLIFSIGMGLSTELYGISSGEGIGAKVISTGNITKNIEDMLGKVHKKESGKNDFMMYDVFNAEIDVDKYLEEAYGDNYNNVGQEFYRKVEDSLRRAAEENPTSEIFQIATNVKGYTSNYDLQIEREGSYALRLNKFKSIGLEGNMSDKLIFMLNNVTKGCIMEGREDEIADYLASVCVAYMWDNAEDIFDLKDLEPNNFHKIYLFDTGGAFLTASQIIQQTLIRLIDPNEDSNKFVQVGIKPPPVYTAYQGLKEKYPVSDLVTKDEWQAQLKNRWDEVRNEALRTGTISIHFNQDQLNELLGNLRTIINS